MAIPAPAMAPELAMLDKVQPGLWELHEAGNTESRERICVRDTRKLLQVRHRALQCNRYVITDTPGNVVVSYRCGSHGHGRTTIKYEDDVLLHINSQGIVDNAPFAFAVEARRVAAC